MESETESPINSSNLEAAKTPTRTTPDRRFDLDDVATCVVLDHHGERSASTADATIT